MLFTEDIYKIARVDRGARFKRLHNGEVYCFDEGGSLAPYNRNGHYVLAPLLDEQWELVRPQVGFMEAANSGGRIRYITWDNFYQLNEALSRLSSSSHFALPVLLNGKWEVE